MTNQVGDRVTAVHFFYDPIVDPIDDNLTVPPGTVGTVRTVDDAGTLHVDWDNGRRIGLLPGYDTWETQ